MSEVLEAKGRNGAVRLDGRSVTIVRKGFFARTSVGKGERHIPLAHVTAVQFKPPGWFMNGFIAFTVPGGLERQSRFGRQTADRTRDENSVVYTWSQRKQFDRLREGVQHTIDALHDAKGQAAPAATTAAATPGIPAQIRQLAELHDAGVLTSAEFETKKADLLSRM